MTSAVVTLTCPQCGGQIHGVEATNQDQTVSCTYCGTELHIPKIGGEVIHERVVVVERPAAPVPAPAVADLPPDPAVLEMRQRSSGPTIVIGFSILLVLVVAFLAIRSHARDDVQRLEQRDNAYDQCEAGCRESCRGGSGGGQPNAEAPQVDDPALQSRLDETMKEANRMECETDCEQKNCMQLLR